MTLARALVILALPPVLAILLALAGLAYAARQGAMADAAQARLDSALARRPDEPVVQAAALLVPGATAGLAASALQARILGLIPDVEVQQIEARGTEAAGDLTRLRVNLRLTGAEAPALQALIALEAATPLIFVDALRVTGQGDGATLAVDLDLSAYAGKVAP
jgi:predicted Zn-dependent protease